MLDTMQNTLIEEGFQTYIIGVNQVDLESTNAQFTDGRDIPWLQDRNDVRLWDSWNVQYRDVYIFDETLTLRDVFNLTENDLNEATNYDTLLTILTTL